MDNRSNGKPKQLDRQEVAKIMGFNFAASVGEVIRGQLGRGTGGQFINVADLQAQVSREAFLRLRRERLQQKLIASRLPKKAKRAQKKAVMRAKSFAEMASRGVMERGDLDALASFRDGNDISQDALNRFAEKGLVEFDAEGKPRMTSAGRGFMRAAERGDIRMALDRLSKAKEQVAKKKERAEKKRRRARELRDDNSKLQSQIRELESEGADRARIERLRERIRRNLNRSGELEIDAGELDRLLGIAKSLDVYLVDIEKQDAPEDIAEEITGYEGELSDLVEAAHRGEITQQEFESRVKEIAGGVLLLAFLKGSDITEVELTVSERERLGREIEAANTSAANFRQDVYGGKFQGDAPGRNSVPARVGLWGAAAVGAYMLGKVHRRDDPLYQWTLGDAEHSPDCLSLGGQVRRASEWQAAGLYPKSGALDCWFGCKCSFTEVSE